ncbi:MAG TPA: ATP-binding protein [Candidatus Limnocylindria bacterium]|nr:ATP-binding protein [Candidatus Limnocylindria bacterium]
MDTATAAGLGAVLGLLVGVVAVLAARSRVTSRVESPEDSLDRGDLPIGTLAVLNALRSAWVVIDATDRLVRVSPTAYALGTVRDGRLTHEDVRDAVRSVRRDHEVRSVQIEQARGRSRPARLAVRLAPLGENLVLVLVDDSSEAQRVDDVRRDFVANVSHELKTPVAALSLLAESVQAASDDPVAVERFAGRMQLEATRLATLIIELIDLSRVQGDVPLAHAEVIPVAELVRDATDRTKLSAAAAQIDLATAVEPGLRVYGDREQLVSALKNLVDNALAYSPPLTRVAVAARSAGDRVDISVTDQGIGIPERDIGRIFERFYRVDPARSRATGGTGLGLSIVKHVCANHGGDVDVWSAEGAGSTFTLKLPAQAPTPQAAVVTPPVSTAAVVPEPSDAHVSFSKLRRAIP